MPLVIKKTIRKFQEHKPGPLLNHKIVVVFRRKQKKITCLVIKIMIVQTVSAAAVIDINDFIIGMVMPG